MREDSRPNIHRDWLLVTSNYLYGLITATIPWSIPTVKWTMIPSTFTGSSRPRRQVNLSGRTNNPFANIGNRSVVAEAQNAVAHAQQERIRRQRERERPPAALTIQRVWRGHRQRSMTRNRWRDEWDQVERQISDQEPYQSPDVCLYQLKLLVHFAIPSNQSDIARLSRFASRFLQYQSLELAVGAFEASFPLSNYLTEIVWHGVDVQRPIL